MDGATLRARGNRYEDFHAGRAFVHHWGRTVTRTDAMLFSILTMHYAPTYFNADFAAQRGHRDMPVNPLLVFNVVFGLSVEDLSEGGGPFLGVDDLQYGVAVYPQDTLRATSVVVGGRLASSRPGYAIATWRTQGHNQRGEEVIVFTRSNLVRTRESLND